MGSPAKIFFKVNTKYLFYGSVIVELCGGFFQLSFLFLFSLPLWLFLYSPVTAFCTRKDLCWKEGGLLQPWKFSINVDRVVVQIYTMSEALWKQCADWLCRLEVLPSNHRIMWPDATIQVSIYSLFKQKFILQLGIYKVTTLRIWRIPWEMEFYCVT